MARCEIIHLILMPVECIKPIEYMFSWWTWEILNRKLNGQCLVHVWHNCGLKIQPSNIIHVLCPHSIHFSLLVVRSMLNIFWEGHILLAREWQMYPNVTCHLVQDILQRCWNDNNRWIDSHLLEYSMSFHRRNMKKKRYVYWIWVFVTNQRQY